jgi:hypothetical protein
MSTIRTSLHATAAASAGLAAAICMAITQLLGLILAAHLTDALLLGLSLSSIAFGGTYAGIFLIAVLHRRSDTAQVLA